MRTDEELNAVILKWMGWEKQEYGWKQYDSTGLRIDKRPDPPDYVHDLNEIHEAEKKLKNKWEAYDFMVNEKWMQHKPGDSWCGYVIHASARQRAEALVAVIEGEKK